jgi:hypothetical protein
MSVIDPTALADQLAPLSHGTQALDIIRAALRQLGKLSAQQVFLNEQLLCMPILHSTICSHFNADLEHFHVLQGDIVRTEAAFVLGIRRVGNPSFVIATSTCDMVQGRREGAMLLSVEKKGRTSEHSPDTLRNQLGNLLACKSTRYFYLPPMPDDEDDVLFNVGVLDPVAHCANVDLATVERRASMTLIGWRYFGALLRSLPVREASDEVAIRRLGSVTAATTSSRRQDPSP